MSTYRCANCKKFDEHVKALKEGTNGLCLKCEDNVEWRRERFNSCVKEFLEVSTLDEAKKLLDEIAAESVVDA